MEPDQPPPPPAAVDDQPAWFACAFPLSRLPAVGSEVYYFPHGHEEQCPDPLPAPLPSAGSVFACTVAAVELFADGKTDEPFATISLLPGSHRHPAPDQPDPDPADADADAAAALTYCGKQLTPSDANNGGGFSVPRFCADLVFPALNFEEDPPAQDLEMWDLSGKSWVFRHIYRGTPRRHLLTTGWTKFVNAKRLVAGDTVVFMRRPDGELLVGARREPRQSHDMVAGPGPFRNARARSPPQEVLQAVALAREGKPFTVRYYPRQGAGEFVVPRREVEAAIAMDWKRGVVVRMKVVSPEDPRRSDTATGIVKTVNRTTIWRMLQITWDDTSSFPWWKRSDVNGWQVQYVGMKGMILPAPCSAIAFESANPLQLQLQGLPLVLPIPAATQQLIPGPMAMAARRSLPPPPPPSPSAASSSEIVNPDQDGSPARQTVSIRLFGTTITTTVPVFHHRRRGTGAQDDHSASSSGGPQA